MPEKFSSASKPKEFARQIPMSFSDYILVGIAALSVLLYLLLLNNRPINLLVGVLLLAWLFYWIKLGRRGNSTPLDVPLISLLVIAALGFFFTPFKDLFYQKIAGLIIGVSAYYLIVNFFRFRQRLPLLIFMLLILGFAMAVLGLFGTDWPVGNFALFDRVYQRLPNIFGMLGIEKINKNTIGGALAFFPPLLLSLLWDKGAFARLKSHNARWSALPSSGYKLLVSFVLGLVLLALLLTQSRGAWLGCAAGIVVLCILKEKRFLWQLPLLLIAFLVVLYWRADGQVLRLLSLLDTSQEATLPGRVEIWSKAFLILRDYPVTGIGLGSFGEAYKLYFASIFLPSSADVVFHAHNTFLSTAVEIGLPGLGMYVILLGGFASLAWKAISYKRTINRVLGLGIASGVVAILVFGLLDAFTLGRNLEILFWIFLGVASALNVYEVALSSSEASFRAFELGSHYKYSDAESSKKRKTQEVLLLVAWLVTSSASLILANVNIIIAFFLAVILGLVLGAHYVSGLEKPHEMA